MSASKSKMELDFLLQDSASNRTSASRHHSNIAQPSTPLEPPVSPFPTRRKSTHSSHHSSHHPTFPNRRNWPYYPSRPEHQMPAPVFPHHAHHHSHSAPMLPPPEDHRALEAATTLSTFPSVSQAPAGSSSADSKSRSRARKEKGSRPRNHKCWCGQSFNKREHLKRHDTLVHNKYRPFKCRECKKDFGTKQNMQVHLTTKKHKQMAMFSSTS